MVVAGGGNPPPPGPPQAARSRPFSAPPPGPGGLEIMYVRVAGPLRSPAPARAVRPTPGPGGSRAPVLAARCPPRSPRASSPPGLGRLRSIHIVALGNEGDAFHQDSRPSGLIRAYLGRSPLVSGDESSLLLSASGAAARPVFTEYQASAFGNVKLVVHDCPVWVRGLTELSFPFLSFLPRPPFHECQRPGHRGRVFFSFFFFTFWGKSLVLRFRGQGPA